MKAAAVSYEIESRPQINEVLVHSGQHYDYQMSDIFFDTLSIPTPGHHLEVGSGSHATQTGKIMIAFEQVLLDEKPDWVLVYGDTNTTLAGALAASKLNIPIAHVEAGLRSFNRKMPEEINRIATDSISDLLFAPTQNAYERLLLEGHKENQVCCVGDVMYDVVIRFKSVAEENSTILSELEIDSSKYALATIHRAENTDQPENLEAIFSALESFSQSMNVVIPLHPRTKKALEQHGMATSSFPSVRFTEPLGLLDMITLESNASLIVTDSGGVQKEAYFHRVPCVTVRTETEWTELVDAEWNRLARPDSQIQISEAIESAVGKKGKDVMLYGGGDASSKIVDNLLNQ